MSWLIWYITAILQLAYCNEQIDRKTYYTTSYKTSIGVKQPMEFLLKSHLEIMPMGTCTSPLKVPANTNYKCDMTNCRVTCLKDYYFPNKKSELNIMCVRGEWIIKESSEWKDIPNCEPVCTPACQNNGICIQPGLCKCPENYYGAFCQDKKIMCASKPPLPKNSKMSCSNTRCIVQCMRGYKFSDDTDITNMECLDGQWKHSKSKEAFVENCTPTCTPSCQNGGSCVSYNICQCPRDFRGKHCQYQISSCNITKTGFNGNYNCNYNTEETVCVINCPKTIEFSSPAAKEYKCQYAEGKFSPQPVPTCVFPEGASLHGSHSSKYELLGSKKIYSSSMYSSMEGSEYDVHGAMGSGSGYYVEGSSAGGGGGGYMKSGSKYYMEGGMEGMEGASGGSEYMKSGSKYSMSGGMSGYGDQGGYMKSESKYSMGGGLEGQSEYSKSGSKYMMGGGTEYLKSSSSSQKNMDMSMNMIEKEKWTGYSAYQSSYLIPGTYSLYMSQSMDFAMKAQMSGLCVTWNGVNIKTFDGLLFKSPLICSHTMIEDGIDATFKIVLKACSAKSDYNCPHSLIIYWQGVEYTLRNKGDIQLYTPHKKLPIPVQIMGIEVSYVGQYLKIDLDTIGINILWDLNKFLSFEASPGLWNRTRGLCGTLDGDIRNELGSKEGKILKTPKSFVDTWRVNFDDDSDCYMEKEMQYDIELCDGSTKDKAKKTCDKLINNEKLTDCFKLLNKTAAIEMCIKDYCNCPNKLSQSVCSCDSLTMLAKECIFKGVKMPNGWRNVEVCPLACNNNRVYSQCGPSIEATCGTTLLPNNKIECVEGCFCPKGTVQYQNKCILEELCPCSLGNKEFQSGSSIQKDCNTCTCKSGFWKCSDITCGSRCASVADPHYTTFDGKRYDFMGKCTYYLLKTKNISVEAENVACPGKISEGMNFKPSISTDNPSCTKSITINYVLDNKDIKIKLSQNRIVYLNDREVMKYPLILGKGDILIRHASSVFLTADFDNGIRIWWDGISRAYIDAPASMRNKTQGLCGTFNSNTQDDFLTPEGDIETAIKPFADKWRTKDSCTLLNDSPIELHPCQDNPQNKEKATKHCTFITEEVFKDCHWTVAPEKFFEDCMFDVCACDDDLSSCYCPILAAYGDECARKGINTNWRYSVKECAIKCPVGQIYDECGDSCVRSCSDIASKSSCNAYCVEGCRCPKGQYLNDNDECIPKSQCPCFYDGLNFETGYKEVRAGRKFLELCACYQGTWKCTESSPGDEVKYPPAGDLKMKCQNKPFMEFSKCAPLEPKTCRNMHKFTEDLYNCKADCICKKGYVFDQSKQICVQPESCSCHHGGRSYDDGDVIQEDCNTCKCASGSWKCTTKSCASICSVGGDSHFTTFDGQDFDFQGACDYILSKGIDANGNGFLITIQNVICGSLGVTCSKSLKISLYGYSNETISLSSDSEISRGKTIKPNEKNSLVMYKAGVFDVIEDSYIGFQVKWDRGTRVYLKLMDKWKKKVSGLCGNYNGDALDDMKSPSHGLETSSTFFGHSWKTKDSCAMPTEQIDSCKEHPERETWAQLKCGILKSSVFQPCHSEVPFERFLKRCIFDTCACDQGGDCECLCTAISAYAYACSIKGIQIKWRKPHLCPMQCEPHCSEYNSCTAPCPIETCDNLLDQGTSNLMCQYENCFEGCKIKECEDGYMYSNETFTECVPKSKCKPICLEEKGIVYYEGDIVSSTDCQTCRCSKNKIVCSGAPCTVPPMIISVTTYSPVLKTEELPICSSGWTKWINQDEFILDNKGTKTKPEKLKVNDMEPLPTYEKLETKYGSCNKEFMTKIECRTVDGHQSPSELDENCDCDLKKGLNCVGKCHDYEIRVFCDCQLSAPLISGSQSKDYAIRIIDKECDIGVEEYKEYPGDCHKFFHCTPKEDGSWTYVEKTCGPNMMFNPNGNICDHIYNVKKIKPDCGEPVAITEVPIKLKQTTTRSTKILQATTTRLPIKLRGLKFCDVKIKEYKEYEGDCHKFLHCSPNADGSWSYVEKSCGTNMMFNPNGNICDFIDNVKKTKPDCGKIIVAEVETPQIKTYEKITEITKTVIKKIEKDYECDIGVKEYKEYHGDCHKFLHCTRAKDGSWTYVEKTCGPDMMFNPNGNICDHIATVKKIKPNCDKPAKINEVVVVKTTEKTKCSKGMKHIACANQCEGTCNFYGQELIKKGKCKIAEKCQEGCVDVATEDCLVQGKLWRDAFTCVDIDECPCMNYQGEIVKPHATFNESQPYDCKTCQCIDNLYVCSECFISYENEEVYSATESHGESKDFYYQMKEKPLIIPTTVTPPIKCLSENYAPIINGDTKLPDQIFGASSNLSLATLPKYARIGVQNSSWSPKINDQMQYLQITLPELRSIYAILMQGSPVSDNYVTLFKILYSVDGAAFHYLIDETEMPQLFSGPVDIKEPVKTFFKIPIEAKVLRIYPLKWHGSIAMQTEIYGCDRQPKRLGIFEEVITTPAPVIVTDYHVSPACNDVMGIETGALKPQQVKASSQLKGIKGVIPEIIDLLKLSSTKGWRPALDSPNEYIHFDFLQPRNITGIKTLGGPDGWVTAFKITYSKKGMVWNNALASEDNTKIFVGNRDGVTVKVNYFKYPIQGQYLKILPYKWKNAINMRIEPLGCFIAYPKVDEKPVEKVVLKTNCSYCPELEMNTIPGSQDCKCTAPKLWSGQMCVQKNECPCFDNHMIYGVGTKFENKDCEECVCTLGGIKQCKPKKCPPCAAGLRHVKSQACFCVCEPCPEFHRLCPSTGDCILESEWCNGIKNCEDDENEECEDTILHVANSTMAVSRKCPDPTCPPGMEVQIIKDVGNEKSAEADIFEISMNTTKITHSGSSSKYYTKIVEKFESIVPSVKAPPRTQLKEKYNDNCLEFVCKPIAEVIMKEKLVCEISKCPEKYEVQYDDLGDSDNCRSYKCILRHPKESICTINGRLFETFDKTQFQYDICSHILVRDLVNNKWTILLRQNCTHEKNICLKQLEIIDLESKISLMLNSDLTVKLNGYNYTAQQLEKSSLIKSSFILSELGNSILVVSKIHGFWISLTKDGNIKVGVSTKLVNSLDGLCGDYNDISDDDKRLPNGDLSDNTIKFGDSWLTKDATKEQCETKKCTDADLEKASKMCKSWQNDITLSICSKTIDMKTVVPQCIENVCECLKLKGSGALDECKCSILQNFVSECLTKQPEAPLDTWRKIHNCEKECPTSQVYTDCYKRICEPTWQNIEGCPVVPNMCSAGCFCPEGTVKKENVCVPITECRDCICDGNGVSKYLTYDRKNFTFLGNCTYLLSRDISMSGEHSFQIYVNFRDCAKVKLDADWIDSNKCSQSLYILSNEHLIILQISKNGTYKIINDGSQIKGLPFENSVISIKETNGKVVSLMLKKSNVQLNSRYIDMSFSIGIPSTIYKDKVEGLCGDCDGNFNNDILPNPKKVKPDKKLIDISDIANTWQADEPKLGLEHTECGKEDLPLSDCRLPDKESLCNKILDQNTFGKCHLVVDPTSYITMCQESQCTSKDKVKICQSLEAYARECARNNICVNWRTIDFCKYECSVNLEYKACDCTKTCKDPNSGCRDGKSEGCFCPSGTVLNQDKCINEEKCHKCQDDIHFPGQVWQKDKCTQCNCRENKTIECKKQKCEVQKKDCEDGFKLVNVTSDSLCCPKYSCEPKGDKCFVFINGVKTAKELGDKWISTDNPCLENVCSHGANKTPTVIGEIKKCDKNCSKGQKYVEILGKCCGKCVQAMCVQESKWYNPGEKWYSKDNCTTYTCKEENNQLMVSSFEETCPHIKDCPENLRYKDGCCTKCKMDTSSKQNCAPVALAHTEQLIQALQYEHGLCTNKEPIGGFYECVGNCLSGSKYNKVSGEHELFCDCCTIKDYKTIQVTLTCNDGHSFKKDVKVPATCECNACKSSVISGDQNEYSNLLDIRSEIKG